LGKLLKLKDWLTAPEAARHLTLLFGEDVSEADVYRLALDGHLTLSVYLVNAASARCGKVIPLEEATFKDVPSLSGETLRLLEGMLLADREVLALKPDVISIAGVWDLPMIGSEALDMVPPDPDPLGAQRLHQPPDGGQVLALVGDEDVGHGVSSAGAPPGPLPSARAIPSSASCL